MKVQILIFISSYLMGLITSFIVLRILRKYKMGQVVRDDGPKSHFKKAGTPTMGGIVILIVSIISLIVGITKYRTILLAMVPFLGFGIVGFIDDIKKLKHENTDGLSPIKKIILLFLISVIFILLYIFVFKLDLNIIVPFYDNYVELSIGMFVLLSVFILLGTSNAINLTDGLDGLASGISACIMTFFVVMSVKMGNQEMSLFGISIIASILSFLLFNIHPAKMFLGDTGSLALGGAIAAIAMITKMPIYLAIVALVPVVETLSSALQIIYFKATRGKRLFKMAPLHHHLEISGVKETTIVGIFWSITVVLCIVACFI